MDSLPLELMKFRCESLEEQGKDNLYSAGAALKAIGGILLHKESGGDVDITSVEILGLHSAVETIGLYLELFAEGLEETGMFLTKKIEELEKEK